MVSIFSLTELRYLSVSLSYAESREYLPMFDLALETFTQMIPHIVSFILLAFIFTKLLYKPVKNILQARAEKIEADINETALNKASALEMKGLYDQKLKDIEAERDIILEDARKEATARLNTILSEAKSEAQDVRDRAKHDIITEKERVKAEIHQAIIDISTDMAAKLVAATIDQQQHDKLFAEAMDELEDTVFGSY